MFFFFQAEDGIRDRTVTGVQTCALPILPRRRTERQRALGEPTCVGIDSHLVAAPEAPAAGSDPERDADSRDRLPRGVEIGRASCRERVEMWVLALVVKVQYNDSEGCWVI